MTLIKYMSCIVFSTPSKQKYGSWFNLTNNFSIPKYSCGVLLTSVLIDPTVTMPKMLDSTDLRFRSSSCTLWSHYVSSPRQRLCLSLKDSQLCCELTLLLNHEADTEIEGEKIK